MQFPAAEAGRDPEVAGAAAAAAGVDEVLPDKAGVDMWLVGNPDESRSAVGTLADRSSVPGSQSRSWSLVVCTLGDSGCLLIRVSVLASNKSDIPYWEGPTLKYWLRFRTV